MVESEENDDKAVPQVRYLNEYGQYSPVVEVGLVFWVNGVGEAAEARLLVQEHTAAFSGSSWSACLFLVVLNPDSLASRYSFLWVFIVCVNGNKDGAKECK